MRPTHLTLLCPVALGHEDPLQHHLDRLPKGGSSPLARVPTIHFARWQLISALPADGPPHPRDELRSQYLLFTCVVDGSRDDCLDALCARIPDGVDAIWGHCADYPGPARANGVAVAAWLAGHEVPLALGYAGYEASVAEVRHCLELRERLGRFAVAAQALAPADLRRSFAAAFSPPAAGGA